MLRSLLPDLAFMWTISSLDILMLQVMEQTATYDTIRYQETQYMMFIQNSVPHFATYCSHNLVRVIPSVSHNNTLWLWSVWSDMFDIPSVSHNNTLWLWSVWHTHTCILYIHTCSFAYSFPYIHAHLHISCMLTWNTHRTTEHIWLQIRKGQNLTFPTLNMTFRAIQWKPKLYKMSTSSQGSSMPK